ncbi:maleylpyruvate isomerase family mycothiol-dependent enzyme [Brachybacterium sp. DNPG3]
MSATTRISTEAEALARLLADAGDAPVPTCPDWTGLDLLAHLTGVHEFWAAILASGATTDEQADALESGAAAPPTSVEEALARREVATAALVHQLEARADDEPAWSWFPPEQTVGFTRRMQVHEATIHRVDAELTAGVPVTPVPSDVASEGLDHCLGVMWAAVALWTPEAAHREALAVLEIAPAGGTARSIEISRATGARASDGTPYALVLTRVLPDGPRDAEAAALPRAVVTGSPLALHLWAWGRAAALERLASGAEQVSLDGDALAVGAVAELLEQGLQ